MPGNPAAARYTPGSWLGVVRSGTVVLLRPDSPVELVESVWDLLGTGPEVHEVLDAVTAASGGALARLPWFAIVHRRTAVQVFLRGEIDLTVDLPSGPVELSGRDVTTWTERRFAMAGGFSLTLPEAENAANAGSGPGLPLADGVVLLRGLRVDFAGAAVPLTSQAPLISRAVPLSPAPPISAATPAVPALPDDVLAAAEADIAADLRDHGASAETVLEFSADDLELDGTLHGEPEPSPDGAGPDAAGPNPSAAPPPAAAEPAEHDPTGSYDHLWEQTVMRNIEDAAVREDPDADPDAGPAAGPADRPADAAPAPAPPAVPAGLIDSVPWRTGGDSPPSPPSRQAAAPVDPAGPLPLQPGADQDHDGETIMKSELAPAPPVRPSGTRRAGTEPATGPVVLARVCPQGHANPSTYSHCGPCGEPLPGDGVQVRRPRLGRMRLSTGELIDLDQSLIVGRQPSVSRVQGAVMPKLVQVASPSGDISRSHVEVRLEGWHVMLCDLKATNGTVLVRDGQSPRRLAQGEMAILLDGDIAEVGDGISLRFEEIP